MQEYFATVLDEFERLDKEMREATFKLMGKVEALDDVRWILDNTCRTCGYYDGRWRKLDEHFKESPNCKPTT